MGYVINRNGKPIGHQGGLQGRLPARWSGEGVTPHTL